MSWMLYEDRDILVCRKPEGIPVQTAKAGQKDMVSILMNELVQKNQKGPVYVIHRLDQPVEGILVFAKNKKAAADLSRQVSDGTMKKRYRAVCRITEQAEQSFPEISEIRDLRAENRSEKEYFGQKPVQMQSAGTEHFLMDYLVKNGRTNTSSVGQKGQKDAKEARLSFRILDVRQERALAEVDLDTGRHHQIRVQMAHAGLPLIGDRKYNPLFQTGDPGTALSAVSLAFDHPSSGKRMEFTIRPEKEAFREWKDEGEKNETVSNGI